MGLRRRSQKIGGDVAGYGGRWRMTLAKLVMWTSGAMMPLTSWRKGTGRYSRCASGEHRVESAEGDISVGRMLVQVISEVGLRV